MFKKMSILSILLLTAGFLSVIAQEAKVKVGCIAFYNLENLYDTIDDPRTDDAEFLPGGANDWTSKRYLLKINNMSEVISQIGDEFTQGGPSIIGVSEIENHRVLEDLISTPRLKKSGYAIVQFDSPDSRGVDVALLYREKDFTVTNAKVVKLTVNWDAKFKTRDQLVVSGLFDGDPLTVIVNHWPSRGHGSEYRMAAGKLTRSIVDSLLKINKDAKIIVMGDLNDDPVDPSIKKNLNTIMYNPMLQMFKNGIGSLAYRDSWNLFDQIILSKAWLRENGVKGYSFYKAKVFNRKFLITKEGQYSGYPFRTFAGGAFLGGYSDHLPVYIFITK